MAFLASMLALLAAAAPAGPDGRLPDVVQPVRYAITWAPDLARGTFRGTVVIDAEAREPVGEVVLHAVDLTIDRAVVTSAGARLAARPRRAGGERLVLALPRRAAAGPLAIAIDFHGRLSTQLRGLYKLEVDGRRYAVTQLEPTDARRAFPCFDEPGRKARVEVTAVIDPGDRAISNGKVVEERLEGRKKIVRFAEMPPLSTYLVALAVGPFELAAERSGAVPVSVWAPPGRKGQAELAADAAADLVARFARWFGVPYPYGKLDLVAVPGFPAGGMENAAAIFARESRLLVDPASASEEDKREVVYLVAHEVAHQWFGDLVTMAWWDDLWLNEAFATWAETESVAEYRPAWRAWLGFASWRRRAVIFDALAGAHPVRVAAERPEEVEESFDAITYAKGAALLRMLAHWLGADVFRRGVGDYLRAHAGGNATAADLWVALEKASGRPVADLARAWFEREGHPLVAVKRRCERGRPSLLVEQRRFAIDPALEKGPPWPIPLCVRAGGREACTLVDTAQAEVPLAGRCGEPFLVNPGQTGFYHVAYAPEDRVGALSLARGEDAALDRLALLDDLARLLWQGGATFEDYHAVARAFSEETSPELLAMLTEDLGTLVDRVLDGEPLDRAGALARVLARPSLQRLGLTPRAGESDADRLTREQALRLGGEVGRDPGIRQQAAEAAAGEVTALDPTLRDVAAAAGDAALYDRFVARMRATPRPLERARLLLSLARFPERELVRRTLALSLTDAVPAQDLVPLYAELLARGSSREETWRFLGARFPAIRNKAPPFGLDRLVVAAGHFCSEADARRVEAFFSAPARRIPSAARALPRALSSIRACAALRARAAAP